MACIQDAILGCSVVLPCELQVIKKLAASTSTSLLFVSEIRQQLVEQLKCFDSRVETKLLLLADFQEFFKKIGELELEYARNTEKVCERFMDKLQRMRVQRKERMTSIDIWKKLLMDLKHRSHLRVTLADVLNNNVANRCWVMSEDVQRTSKWVSVLSKPLLTGLVSCLLTHFSQ